MLEDETTKVIQHFSVVCYTSSSFGTVGFSGWSCFSVLEEGIWVNSTSFTDTFYYVKSVVSEDPISSDRPMLESRGNRQFTYSEVLTITNNFQAVIGEGGFGTLYLGQLGETIQVAVKMLSPSSVQGYKEFRAEVNICYPTPYLVFLPKI